MLISETQILEVLRRQNSWWQTGQIPESLVPEFRRLPFYEILSLLRQPGLNRAVVLTGMRRVGKTVLLHQLAADFLNVAKVPPKKILYISFEDLALTQATLREILNLYEKNVVSIGKDTLILLDEIHYTVQWSRYLMTVLREYPGARIVATGSAAVLLKDKTNNESGMGRWTDVHIPTLSFYEYIRMREKRKESAAPTLPANLDLPTLLKSNSKQRESLLQACLKLEIEFNRYLLQGGFPAFVYNEFSLTLAHRFLREDVIDKALKRDMAHLYGARSLAELDQLFVYLCFNPGAMVEKSTLASALGVVAPTVESHFQRLEDAHLIYRLNPINLEGKKSLKPRPKIYIADPSLRNAVILRGEGLFENETELGVIIELCIFKHLYAFYYHDKPRCGYWRNSKTDKEVDFVMIFPNGKQIAWEVKYKEQPETDSLSEWVSAHPDSEQVLLITKKTADYGPATGGKIFRIPAFVFAYLLGHIEFQRWQADFSYGQSSRPLPKEVLENLPIAEAPKKEV